MSSNKIDNCESLYLSCDNIRQMVKQFDDLQVEYEFDAKDGTLLVKDPTNNDKELVRSMRMGNTPHTPWYTRYNSNFIGPVEK